MNTDTEYLERLKLILQIVATIAVPVIVAVIGYNVQKGLSDKEVSKSYVQMATEILKSPPSKGDTELREWAIEIMNKQSPVPISKALKEQLKNPSSSGLADLATREQPTNSDSDSVLLEDSMTKKPIQIGILDPKVTSGIYKYVECIKAKDAETVTWMLKTFKNQYFKCKKSDEIGVMRYTTQR